MGQNNLTGLGNHRRSPTLPRSEKPANPAPAAGVADEAKKPFQPGVRVSEPVERALADKVASTASLQAWEQSANVFTRGSERLAYWTAGEGKPLILVHGFPTASYDWHQVWPDLSKDRKLYAMDMLGFGFSDKPKSASYSTFAQADRLQDFIASKGQSEVDLLSHDFGDTVVQELLARQNEGKLPFKIRSVSLLNGGLFPETHKPTVVQKLLASKAGNFVEKLIFRPIFKMGLKQVLGEQSKGNSQFLNDATEQVFRHGGVGLAHEQLGYIEERRQNRGRWVEALQNASNPPPGGKIPPVRLQLIDGLADTISGAHMVDNFKKWVPAATVVGIAGVGHYPQVEAPAQVVSEMKRFLNR